MIKKLPLPFAGVMLGLAALGNLIQSYSESLRTVCGVLSALIGIGLIAKLILYPDMFKKDMKDPVIASVSGTFSMALMLLAGYLKPVLGQSSIFIWYLGIILHVMLIIYFTINFIFKLNMKKVFASYFIVYVGIAAASVSAPVFNSTGIGTACFWFGFVTVILLLLLVTYRYVKFKEIPEPAKPLFCIYTAPVSLCVAGYIQSVMPKSKTFLLVMIAVSSIIYLIVLFNLPKYLKMKFYPSYAAFTFPFVISAIALKQTMACLGNMGSPVPWLKYPVLIETIIAVVLVLYTLIRFLMALCKKSKVEVKSK